MRYLKENLKLEEKFILHAVSDGGKNLWRSLILERSRLLFDHGRIKQE